MHQHVGQRIELAQPQVGNRHLQPGPARGAPAVGLALPTTLLENGAHQGRVAGYVGGQDHNVARLDVRMAVEQLGDAVQRMEQRSGLAQGDLDALWSATQQAADADNAGFCAEAAGLDFYRMGPGLVRLVTNFRTTTAEVDDALGRFAEALIPV